MGVRHNNGPARHARHSEPNGGARRWSGSALAVESCRQLAASIAGLRGLLQRRKPSLEGSPLGAVPVAISFQLGYLPGEFPDFLGLTRILAGLLLQLVE